MAEVFVFFLQVTGDHFTSVLIAFLPLSAINLYATFRTCDLVQINTLNLQRGERLIASMLDGGSPLSPAQVAAEEVFVRPYVSEFTVPLLLDLPLASLGKMCGDTLKDTMEQRHYCQAERYYLAVVRDRAGKEGSPSVALWFDDRASSHDQVAGFTHACALRRRLGESAWAGDDAGAIRATHVDTAGKAAAEIEAAGWNLQTVALSNTAAPVFVPS